ncbi:Uu.00g053670.m01.CDS01 [Anthostomella pinea]|uniref:Uu.00g053670.m01.CDS01 n=1 Tax=Anthostomella pinea TaxID=933095 RepID=A0AAI8VWF4_9PEZI|nr:Uu.00g053670.m01.CDS01 [Anthostomella pinea]
MLLIELPPEIIHHILGYVNPPDLAWCPRICKTLYHAVTGNSALFKLVYLHHFDKPQTGDVDWAQSLKDLVRLQVICRRDSVEAKKSELDFVHSTVTALLKNATTQGARPFVSATHPRSRNADLLSSIFSTETNQSAFLCRSIIYERARAEFRAGVHSHAPPGPAHQKSAQLHCLYGVPMLYAYPGVGRVTRSSRMSPFACSKVYDLRQYTRRTKWGPFMDDDTDRVDWEKVEAIMIVLGNNLRKLGLDHYPICRLFCQVPFAGTWPGSYKALPIDTVAEPEELKLLDPYGITGTWLRVVCFLDYTDFFAYNFAPEDQPPPHIARPAIDVGEATRLILMRVVVTKIEPPGPEDGQELPVVYFKGVSRSLDDSYDENANSDLRGTIQVRGCVRLTREGEVRWTTFSVFAGMERWRSESIQLGGVKSAKGVLGNWFDKDFDPRGPAGPTAFWKISDGSTTGGTSFLREYMPMAELLDEADGDFEPSSENEENENEDSESDWFDWLQGELNG